MKRPALAVSTLVLAAFATAAHAQGPAAGAPVFSLTGSLGVMGFSLPAFDTGPFGHSAGNTLIGGMIGENFSADLGKVTKDWDLLASVTGFVAYAGGSQSWTDNFTTTSPATVIISGASTPTVGSIDLSTSGGSSTAIISNTNPQGGGSTNNASAGGGATNNVGFVSPGDTGNSFILGALTSDGAGTRAAYGAIADTSGGVFVATGDIAGLSVTTTASRRLFYYGADLTLGLGGKLDDKTSLQIYGGPSYRRLNQSSTTNVSIDIPELPPTVTTFPDFTISDDNELASDYLGAILGTNLSFVLKPGVIYTLGLEGGLYHVNTSFTGQDTYSTCCGDFSAGPLLGASPNLSVSADPNAIAFASDTAFALRANTSFTFALNANQSITLGGNVEYLSKVAAASSGLPQVTVIPGGRDVNYTSPGSASTPVFSWGSMINYGVTGAFTGTF